jgi:hypothetical protein
MTMKLTAETIHNRQIRALGIAAFERSDLALFDLTVAVIEGDGAARQRCAEAINAENDAAARKAGAL